LLDDGDVDDGDDVTTAYSAFYYTLPIMINMGSS
jgi:hypothetical protein